MQQKESGDLYSPKVLKVAGLGLCNKAVKWRARGWATTNSAARALLLAVTALSSCMRFICAVAACGSREKQSGMVSSVASSAYLREGFFMPYIYGTYTILRFMNTCLGLLFFVPTVRGTSPPGLHVPITITRPALPPIGLHGSSPSVAATQRRSPLSH